MISYIIEESSEEQSVTSIVKRTLEVSLELLELSGKEGALHGDDTLRTGLSGQW